ncbi:PAS domain-containing sensor histidine kinase [Mucilaginibacter sp. PAMB04168]|uniref:PAS domain-containing sensor histidine kinase n=1 Tax=Mucilaginibacter sp. PAMB04168 TaxID=3138567 RepID=UPI0031F6FE7B
MERVDIDFLKKVAEQADEVYFIYDYQGNRFEFINNAFEYVTKLSCQELINNPAMLLNIVHPDDVDYVKSEYIAAGKRQSKALINFRILRPDKVERWIRLKIYPVLDGNDTAFVFGIAEDDTPRKAGFSNMQKVNEWKDSVMGILSHDLRGPIGIISTLASAIGAELPAEDHTQVHEWLKMIRDVSKKNLEMIKNLLSTEPLDTTKVVLSKERLDLVQEVRQVMDIFIQSPNSLSTKFEFTCSHDKIFAQVDHSKFLQVINKLMSNAITLTRDDGLIKVHMEQLENSVTITVENNGSGIPKKLQPVLFHKPAEAVANGEEPVGLDMWVVRSIMESHGGSVWFESDERKSCKFYVDFPIGLNF